MDEGVAAEAGADAQDLVGDARHERHEDDARGGANQNASVHQQIEDEEGDQSDKDDNQQEAGTAAGVLFGEGADLFGGERAARFVGVDRHVLGAVVLEDSPDIGDHANQPDVTDEQPEPHDPFNPDDHETAGIDRL